MNNKKFYRIAKRVLIILLASIIVILLFKYVYPYLGKSSPVALENIKQEKKEDKIINSGKYEDMILEGKARTPGALRLMNLISPKEEVYLSKDKVIEITNNYRRENKNLIALKENAKLKLSAEKKMQDMFTNQYFEHISPTGEGIEKLVQGVSYKYILTGENLAMGVFKDDKSLVDAWMKSIGHRDNILNKNYREIGVAIGKGIFEGKEVWIAVQHFGTPASVCPSIDESLYKQINSKQAEINTIEQDLELRLRVIEREVVPYEGNSDLVANIEAYNNLVIYYNKLAEEIKNKTYSYNEQIHKFNSCLIEYQ